MDEVWSSIRSKLFAVVLGLQLGAFTPTRLARAEADVASAPTGSAPSKTRVRLSFQAPPGCSSSEEFRSTVSGLTESVEWTEDATADRVVTVTLEPEARRGTLTFAEPGAATTRREVTHEDCRWLTQGLGFVLAVALDPTVTAPAPLSELPVTGEAPAPAPVVQPEPVLDPFRVEAEPRDAVPVPDRAPIEEAKPAPSPPPARTRGDVRFSLGADVERGLGEAFTPGAFAGLQLRVIPSRGASAASKASPPVLAPLFGLGGRAAFFGAGAEGVEASGTKLAGVLSACPVWLRLAASVRLAPCAEVELGTLWVRASGLEASSPESVGWAAGGARLDLDFVQPSGVFTLGAGGRFNATRPSFSFRDTEDGPRTELLAVPYFSAFVAISGSLSIHESEF